VLWNETAPLALSTEHLLSDVARGGVVRKHPKNGGKMEESCMYCWQCAEPKVTPFTLTAKQESLNEI
jgi:hypothetical protein